MLGGECHSDCNNAQTGISRVIEQITISSAKDLRSYFAKFGEKALFRGQTNHYGNLDQPSVMSSFDRKGCIPNQMMKWSRYAGDILAANFGADATAMEFTQALLQHYGWRSFYVDCSSNPAVAAWFASHMYTEHPTGGLCEDYQERPVHLKKRGARYEFEQGVGHLYVIDREVAKMTVGVTDLAVLQTEGFRNRPEAQSAWLLGPILKGQVPEECFLSHVTASRSVLYEYAKEEGFIETESLFPPQREDPIFRALLSLPWKAHGRLGTGPSSIGIFCRSLDLPEYEDTWVKIAPESVAFFNGDSIGQTFPVIYGGKDGTTIQVPEIAFWGSSDLPTPLKYPKIGRLLADHENLAFEIDDLIQPAVLSQSSRYQKGLGVLTLEPNLIVVCELVVEHPGLDLEGVSFARGWFYRVSEDGVWKRENHSEQCECSDDSVHLRHLSSLQIIETLLEEPVS